MARGETAGHRGRRRSAGAADDGPVAVPGRVCRRVRRLVAGPRVQPGDHRQRHRPAGADPRGPGPARVGGDAGGHRPGRRRPGGEGRATSTRREYVQIFKGFHRFLQARKAAEIEAAFGVRLVCPVDEFNASRHVGDDSPALLPPPTPERVGEFFDFMKQRIATARKYGPAARDYAMFRTLYHAGLRSEEASLLERPDLHFTRGPFGKLHVRFGKGAHTSGPRPRWVPMLDGLDLVLRLVPRGCAAQVPRLTGAVRRRVRWQPPSRDDPQPAALSDGTRRTSGSRAVQPACPATGLRDPQLRTRRRPRGDPADARSLDGQFDHAICPALGDLHRGRLSTGGRQHPGRADREGPTA